MSSDERAIRGVVGEWLAAKAVGDAGRHAPLLAEDIAFLTPCQPPVRGRDLFIEGLGHLFKQFEIKPEGEILEIRISDDMAYCWSQLTVTIRPRAGGSPVIRSGHALSVLRKSADGNWVISRDANTLMTEDD